MYNKSNVYSLFNNLEFLWNGFQISFFFFNGNFGFLSKWHASQAPLQTVPPRHP